MFCLWKLSEKEVAAPFAAIKRSISRTQRTDFEHNMLYQDIYQERKMTKCFLKLKKLIRRIFGYCKYPILSILKINLARMYRMIFFVCFSHINC